MTDADNTRLSAFLAQILEPGSPFAGQFISVSAADDTPMARCTQCGVDVRAFEAGVHPFSKLSSPQRWVRALRHHNAECRRARLRAPSR
jgi:hypothetical protein